MIWTERKKWWGLHAAAQQKHTHTHRRSSATTACLKCTASQRRRSHRERIYQKFIHDESQTHEKTSVAHGFLQTSTHIGWSVRDKHVSSSVRNGKRDLTVHQDTLRRDTTGMKDGNLMWLQFNCITPIWLHETIRRYTNGFGTSDTQWTAVCVWKFRCDFDLFGYLQG